MRQTRLRPRRVRAPAHNDRDRGLGLLRVRRALVWFNVELLADALLLLLLPPAVHKSNCRVASQVSGAPDSLFDLRTGHPCAFVLINCARCAAFNTPLRRKDAPDPNTPPTPAQQWLPAVATEWAFVEAPPLAAVEMTPADTVVEQPTESLPSAKAVLP